MPQPTDAQDSNGISRPRSAMAQAVVGGHAGAHQRCGVHVRQIVRNQRQCIGRRNHVVGIAAIETDPGDLRVFAENKVALAAGNAVVAVPAMPAQAHPLSCLEEWNVSPHSIHHASNLMPRYAGIGDAGKEAELGNRIAVANAAGLHADAHMARPRLGKLPLHHFKGAARCGNLHCASTD